MARLGIEVTARNQAAGVLGQLDRQLRGLGSATGGLLGTVAAFATGGLVLQGLNTVGRAVKGLGADALTGAMDLQSGLAMFETVSNATAEQMEAVREKAVELGADMTLPATSAGNAAEAMLELGKAGLSVNDVLGASQGTLQLAAAGALTEAEAAEITANALNAFGLAGSEATRIANLLAGAANASSAEVYDVAASLQMSSAVAAQAGVPIEDLVTAISQLANAGIKGSDAGTSLKTMLLSLMAPSGEAAQAMETLGISLRDAQGNLLPLPELIEEFSTKLAVGAKQMVEVGGATGAQAKELKSYETKIRSAREAIEKYNAGVQGTTLSEKVRTTRIAELNGQIAFYQQKHDELAATIPGVTTATVELTKAEQDAALKTIFGTDAIRAANIVLMDGAEAHDTMAAAVGRDGAAAELAGARMTGLKGAFEGVKSQIETLGLVAAEPLLEPLETGFRALADALGSPAVQAAMENAGKWIGEGLGAAMERLGPALATAAEKLPGFLETVSGIVQIFQTGKPPLQDWESIVQIFQSGGQPLGDWEAFQRILNETFGPETGEKIGTASQLLMGIVNIFQGGEPLGNWETFQRVLNETFGPETGEKIGQVSVALSVVRDWIGTHLPGAIAESQTQFEMLRDDLLGASGEAARIASEYAAGFRDTIGTIKASPAWEAVTGFFSSVAGAIESANSALSSFISRINQAKSASQNFGGIIGGVQANTMNLPGTPGYVPPNAGSPTYGRTNATGTLFAPGGLSLVGEAGPELVMLPRGSRVYSAGETREIQREQQRGITNNVTVYATVGSQVDVTALAYKVADEIRRRQ